MDITFILPAILFTLLAIFLATTLFNNNNGASSATSQLDNSGFLAQSGRVEAKPGLDKPGASVNLTENQLKTRGGLTSVDKAEERRTDRVAAVGTIAVEEEEGLPVTEFGSCTHAHEKTVKMGITGESDSEPATVGEITTTDQHCSLTRSSETTFDPAPVPVGFPGSIESTEGESLLCPFTYRQTGGTSESQESNVDMEQVDTDGQSLKYVPGMLRTSGLEKMMTKDELEDEQRVEFTTDFTSLVQREQLAAIFQLLKQNQETFGEVSEGDVEEQLKLYSI